MNMQCLFDCSRIWRHLLHVSRIVITSTSRFPFRWWMDWNAWIHGNLPSFIRRTHYLISNNAMVMRWDTDLSYHESASMLCERVASRKWSAMAQHADSHDATIRHISHACYYTGDLACPFHFFSRKYYYINYYVTGYEKKYKLNQHRLVITNHLIVMKKYGCIISEVVNLVSKVNIKLTLKGFGLKEFLIFVR